eukprot:TRINITY_DN20088_c0_g1::TRINITY_DN20088_c0_g1_i1::g.15684::m.15684 TRINITY_DN20088_c0_g1::TRINITY_DN20088_c0_g1_i1::g.15684  ORF type:complete len:231 (-),score=11.75,FUSC_2/PF13515.1/0.084 TRINITY_DN20088_c0_g1_i1:352-1044(-)
MNRLRSLVQGVIKRAPSAPPTAPAKPNENATTVSKVLEAGTALSTKARSLMSLAIIDRVLLNRQVIQEAVKGFKFGGAAGAVKNAGLQAVQRTTQEVKNIATDRSTKIATETLAKAGAKTVENIGGSWRRVRNRTMGFILVCIFVYAAGSATPQAIARYAVMREYYRNQAHLRESGDDDDRSSDRKDIVKAARDIPVTPEPPTLLDLTRTTGHWAYSTVSSVWSKVSGRP